MSTWAKIAIEGSGHGARPQGHARENPVYRWGMLLLLVSVLALEVASMQRITPTYDEPAHFQYGRNILSLDSTRFDDSKMPVTALNALPARLAAALRLDAPDATPGHIQMGRFVTILFSLLVAYCVFRWARDLYGSAGALLALTLYAFDPNLLAHSQLVTTDPYATGMITLSLYFFWRFLTLGGWARASVSALVVGLSQISKYTAVLLFPLLILIVLGWWSNDLWTIVRARRYSDLAHRLLSFTGFALLFLLVSLIVINAGFLFNRTFTPLKDYDFRSELFRSIQSSNGRVGNLPVPVPYPYLEGLDWVIQRERTGGGLGNLYLLGEIRSGGNAFKGYYLYACLFKLPIATQLLILTAAATYLVRFRFESFRNEWVLICPIIVFTLYFNFFNRAQIGIRFFLVVFPLLFIFCGRLLKDPASLPRPARAALAGILAYLVISVLSYYPHFLSYFNELVWDRKQAYRVLADSNIDWGQHQWYLEQYRKAHPEAIINPGDPIAGTIVVGINALTGIVGPERYRWLRENFRPAGHVAYSFLVFQVSPVDLERIKGARR